MFSVRYETLNITFSTISMKYFFGLVKNEMKACMSRKKHWMKCSKNSFKYHNAPTFRFLTIKHSLSIAGFTAILGFDNKEFFLVLPTIKYFNKWDSKYFFSLDSCRDLINTFFQIFPKSFSPAFRSHTSKFSLVFQFRFN